MTRWIKLTSMLPPESRHTVLRPEVSTLPLSAAARLAAPEGSTISLLRSMSSSMAEEISLSLTVTMSSTYLSISATVFSPGLPTAMPSAIVETPFVVMCLPALKLW